jgi:hypothetical protein
MGSRLGSSSSRPGSVGLRAGRHIFFFTGGGRHISGNYFSILIPILRIAREWGGGGAWESMKRGVEGVEEDQPEG